MAGKGSVSGQGPGPASASSHRRLEFYLLNYFKPAHAEQNETMGHGRDVFNGIGCQSCHAANFTINRDRRVADAETVSDSVNGVFNFNLGSRSTAYFPEGRHGSISLTVLFQNPSDPE